MAGTTPGPESAATEPGRMLASIDIGSNSAILLIAERRHGVLLPVLQKVTAPRVGRDLGATGRISDSSFAALMAALEGFLAEIRSRGARLAGAVATEAFRKAANGPELLARISALLGSPCRILAGEEEARLGWLAVHDRHPSDSLAVIDIGAGSTEVTTKEGGISLPLGAVALLEACGPSPAALRGRASEILRAGLAGRTWPADLVAVGGTATAAAMLALGLGRFDADAIEGLELEAAAVTRQIERLAAMPIAERAALPGLDPGRAEIVVPGLCILESVLRLSGRDRFRVSDRGIRYGVILDFEPRASGNSP